MQEGLRLENVRFSNNCVLRMETIIVAEFDHFRLKNEMLFVNYLANLIGVCVVIFLTYRPLSRQLVDSLRLIGRIGWFFEPLCGALMLVLTLVYEKPIRRFLDAQGSGGQLSEDRGQATDDRLWGDGGTGSYGMGRIKVGSIK